jgi:hypothetical protein
MNTNVTEDIVPRTTESDQRNDVAVTSQFELMSIHSTSSIKAY